MSDADTKRESTIGKIRALMARTVANGCTEAEAAAAAAAVDRLMESYEIDLDEVTLRQQEIVIVSVPNAGISNVKYAAQNVARFTDCKVWVSGRRDLKFLGFTLDTQIAEYLTLLFMRSIERETISFRMFNAEMRSKTSQGQADMIDSFEIGMAERLGERLKEMKSKRDFTAEQRGNALVVVKLPLVTAAMAEMGIKIGKAGKGKPIADPASYSKGRSAGDTVAINQGIGGYAEKRGALR